MKLGIEDIRALTRMRKDAGRIPAIVPARRMVSWRSDAKRRCFRRRVSFL